MLMGFLPKPMAEAARKGSEDIQRTSKQQMVEAYGKLPLGFERNAGQSSNQVKFLSRGPGYTLFLTRQGEAVVVDAAEVQHIPETQADPLAGVVKPRTESTPPSVFRMKLVNARVTPQAQGLNELPGKANYFIGNDPKKWRTNVPIYTKVNFHGVYPGVDLTYYGDRRQLEYDFIVAPRADPGSITMAVEGAEMSLDAQGDLVLAVKDREIRFQKPVTYQEVDGERREIPSKYLLKSAHQAGFQIAAYDHSRPLIIDPVLSYSTYLGGSRSDFGVGIAVDSGGNAYVTGSTVSNDFPTTTGAVQASVLTICQPFPGCNTEYAFVTKLNPTGSALVYSTYFGGTARNDGTGIAVDSAENAYVTGETSSTDFPTTPGAFQPIQRSLNGGYNAFITKLNPDGSGLVYSTYLGGAAGSRTQQSFSTGGDSARGIAIDSAGNAYVTGITDSIDFPTTPLAYQPVNHGALNKVSNAFVTKLNNTGSLLVYSTYLGGSGNPGGPSGATSDQGLGIALDSAGNAYVTGLTPSRDFPTTLGTYQPANRATLSNEFNAFVTKLNGTGTGVVYSTYLGGTGPDYVTAIAVDSNGNAYVTGASGSIDFPTTLGAFQFLAPGNGDAFVTKLNAAGSGLVYSTYVGGSSSDSGSSIAVDSAGDTFVTGYSNSTNFPTTANAIQPTPDAGGDGFVLALNPQGSALPYSSFLGGSGANPGFEQGRGIALDSSLSAYVTGSTQSVSFPTTPGAFLSTAPGGGGAHAFVTKIASITCTSSCP